MDSDSVPKYETSKLLSGTKELFEQALQLAKEQQNQRKWNLACCMIVLFLSNMGFCKRISFFMAVSSSRWRI